MNINYHYFTVKTLARYAGLNERQSQIIAHFSQQVDNYILSSPFLVEEQPPSFFLKNGLACSLSDKLWIFSPCPTGLNKLSVVLHKYQLHTLMPFHFILPAACPEGIPDADRRHLRCMTSGDRRGLLIDSLMQDVIRRADLSNDAWLIEFGMLLHTFADTYAHCHFSGFRGWENESYVAEITRNQTLDSAMKPMEIALYRSLPPIGHSNAGFAPDVCNCSITLFFKSDAGDPLRPLIERDNTVFFADCSRRIFMALCQINGRAFPDEASWNSLQRRLARAQDHQSPANEKALQKNWSDVFPDLQYDFDKNEFFDLSLHPLRLDEQLIRQFDAKPAHLIDAYSAQGDRARAISITRAREANRFFYLYNELAYRHVHAVTGAHASAEDAAQLSAYCALAEKIVGL